MQRRRVFFALLPDDRTLVRLRRVQRSVLADVPGWQTLHPATLHLTLAFLGGRSDAELQALMAMAREIPFRPLALETGDWLLLPPRRPRVIALAVEWTAALGMLADDLQGRIGGLGIELDRRPFLPHVSLARVRQGAAGVPGVLPSASLSCSRFGLFESCPEATGPRYRPLWVCSAGQD